MSTVWKTVERDVKIPHNLETTPLKIKTDSTAGSEETVVVKLNTAGGAWVGQVYFKFGSPPKYQIAGCIQSLTDFLSTLPSEENKIWTITKLPGPRLTLQCNSVTVLDITMSNGTCRPSDWSTYWSRQIEQIKFYSGDTASDEYWAAPPGNTLIIFNINCLSS